MTSPLNVFAICIASLDFPVPVAPRTTIKGKRFNISQFVRESMPLTEARAAAHLETKP